MCYYVEENGLVEPESQLGDNFQSRGEATIVYTKVSGGVGQKLSDSGYILRA